MTRQRRRLLPQNWPCLFGFAGLLSLWPVGPRASEGVNSGYADLIARVLPSVVNISVRKAVQVADGSETRDGDQVVLGSGFIIDPSGYVVTNRHVVVDAYSITVQLSDGRRLVADVVGHPPATDIALLKVKSDLSLPAVHFGESDNVGSATRCWRSAIRLASAARLHPALSVP